MSNLPKNPTVFILGGGQPYISMFKAMGWNIVDNVKDADLVQFTGGADVSPSLYGHRSHPNTTNNIARDKREEMVFKACRKMDKPMSGICRGGQFLNVMSGGTMFQDCDGHAIMGTHTAVDMETGKMVAVTSTHHQIMRPSVDSVSVMEAQVSKWREIFIHNSPIRHNRFVRENDCEAVYYPKTKSFCFQPHPEFDGYVLLRNTYFNQFTRYLFT